LVVSLRTPEKVEKLQAALHAKAKGAPSYRFYALYDKVYREDVLAFAYRLCRHNGGAAGVDGERFEEFLGTSDRAKNIRAAARRAARSESPVLLQGEPGTGKTFLARGIHAAGGSASGPFVVVYCAAVAAGDLSARIRQSDELEIREYSPAVRAFKRRLVSTIVAECGGHQGRAAEELGPHRSNLSRIIRDLDLLDVV
jgi:DNA-binding NtrC family response regulator